MAKQDKIIAGVLVFHGTTGIVWTIWLASKIGYPALFITLNLMLAVLGIVAGVGCFRGDDRSAPLGQLFWAVQLLHFVTGAFTFSFTLGLNLVFSLGWINFGQMGVNVFALGMMVWLARRMGNPGSPLYRGSRSSSMMATTTHEQAAVMPEPSKGSE
ncbi:hypothetical protein [Dyella silvae]|uniref:hypothetical protein n=1 Tax=Dyella silvae TaxID=2994424 RepID=UPI002265523C|nr:hypothetical protein [Dyella silvae]